MVGLARVESGVSGVISIAKGCERWGPTASHAGWIQARANTYSCDIVSINIGLVGDLRSTVLASAPDPVIPLPE